MSRFLWRNGAGRTYTYNANGNQTMSEYDSNVDGTVDSRYSTSYQAINRWFLIWWD